LVVAVSADAVALVALVLAEEALPAAAVADVLALLALVLAEVAEAVADAALLDALVAELAAAVALAAASVRSVSSCPKFGRSVPSTAGPTSVIRLPCMLMSP
jgi:hypothetical protein